MLKKFGSEGPIKVLIVDDSAFYRQTFSSMLRTVAEIKVVGVVADGTEAIRFLSLDDADVITLDLEMPRMDGFTFLRWVMANHPIPVLVVSSLSDKSNIFKALDLGAVDFLAKPTQRASLEIMKIQEDLISKVQIAAAVPIDKLRPRVSEVAPSEPGSPALTETPRVFTGDTVISDRSVGEVRVIVIGASTGGPPAIQSIITQLPQDLSYPIAIAQHMPRGFTEFFAKRLDNLSGLTITEAKDDEAVEPGHVYISPGGHHLTFKRRKGRIRLSLKERVDGDKYSPSVDLLMESAADIYGSRTMGVLLTGMGRDGKQGMRSIKEKGGVTLAESEETAVVFGMPKEAIQEGVVEKILPLHRMPEEILRRCGKFNKAL